MTVNAESAERAIEIATNSWINEDVRDLVVVDDSIRIHRESDA